MFKYLVVICIYLNINSFVLTTGHRLILCDEFNYSGLPGSTIWTFEQGMMRNNDAQYYTNKRKENAWSKMGTCY